MDRFNPVRVDPTVARCIFGAGLAMGFVAGFFAALLLVHL